MPQSLLRPRATGETDPENQEPEDPHNDETAPLGAETPGPG